MFFLLLLWVIFFADNSHGGHLSVFLHAVKAPFDISVIFSLYTIFSPTSLGSLSGFKNSLFKFIWILSPVSWPELIFIKAYLISKLFLLESVIWALLIRIVFLLRLYLQKNL